MAAAGSSMRTQWLYGPASDLLFGGCLVYLPLFALLVFANPWMQSVVPPTLLPLVILAFGTPHVGATLLRAYEREEDRRAYRLFVLHLTLLLTLLFGLALYVPVMGSLLLTLYLTVVPWHFMAQNYGVQLVFLRRRGIEVSPALKRQLWFSFVLPYVMTLFSLHTGTLGDNYAPFESDGTPYGFLSLGIPRSVHEVVFPVLLGGYLYALGSSLVMLRRQAFWRELLPVLALFLVQALWYVVPNLIASERFDPFSPANATYTFVWINQVHAVQYLWIASYYERRRDPALRMGPYLAKAVLAGSAVYGFPILLLGPSVLGGLPHGAGLYLMVAGALNLHHILIDSAIWKLRDGRLARILLRPGEAVSGGGPRRRSWVAGLVWASGVVGVLTTIVGTLEYQYGFVDALRDRDRARLEQAAQRLPWVGRADPGVLAGLAALRLQEGDVEGALRAAEESNALRENVRAWHVIGSVRERQHDLDGALDAYRAGLDLEAEDLPVLLYAGRAALSGGQRDQGLAFLERARKLAPGHPEVRRELQRAAAPQETRSARQ